MAKNLFSIIDEIKRYNMNVTLITNGYLISKRIKDIVNSGVSVMISIDSISPEKHDKMRRVPGIWGKAVEGAKELRKQGVATSIGATVTRYNFKEMKDYIEMARTLGVGFRFQPVHNCSSNYFTGSNNKPEILFSQNEFEELKNAFNFVDDVPLSWIDEIYYKLSPLFLTHPEKVTVIKCPTACRTIYFIEPNGNVCPCDGLRNLVLGNIKEKQFSDIINSEYAKEIRKSLYSDKRKCICWYRCTAPDMILYQFPHIFPSLIKKKWEDKISELEGRT